MVSQQQWQQTCPLCGADNRCAVAAGQSPASCWCAAVTISPGALAAVPLESVDRRCICPACGQSEGETGNER